MIISHRYKFIYLRTEKTASTSLSSVLTRLVAKEETVIKSFRGTFENALPMNLGGLKLAYPRLFGFHPHAHARDIRRILGSAIFDNYFKFAVERNPWERQVSLYHHREFKRANKSPDFSRDMNSRLYRVLHHTHLCNWDVYAINGKVVADRILQYETLNNDLPCLLEKLGIASKIELPHRNSSYSGERPHYSTYYDNQTRELIANWYQREIDAFGYKFDDKRATAAPVTAH